MYCKKIKQAIPFILVTAGLIGLSSQAYAERGDLTVMGKYGQTQPDGFDLPNGNGGTFSVDPDGDSAFGIAIGYEYDPNWTIEFAYDKGDGSDNSFQSEISTDYTSIALHGVYRTPIELGAPYFLGKIGFGKVDIDISQGSFSETQSGTRATFGAGVGYQYSEQLGFEAEYRVAAADVSFIFVSARYHLNN